MLIVRKNEVNNLIATVSMNKTLANPYYLFSFQHIASKERVSFIPQVITSNVRYDKFRFREGGNVNLTSTPPEIYFQYLGQYYYSIYEQVSSVNTDPSLAYNKLESGRAWVIVGDDKTQECFFEPYISNDEDFSQIIYVSEEEQECISGDTSPDCFSAMTGNCPTFVSRATPPYLYYKNGLLGDFQLDFNSCLPGGIAMSDTKLFMVDGCSNYYEYDYTISSGGCFSTNLIRSFELWDVPQYSGTPNALYAIAIYDDNNIIVGANESNISQTGSTLYLYDLTTSGLTTWLEVGDGSKVSTVLYNTATTQSLIVQTKAYSDDVVYQLYSGSTNPILTNSLSGISFNGTSIYFSGETPISVNLGATQFELDFTGNSINQILNAQNLPIPYIGFIGGGFEQLAEIVQPNRCYDFEICPTGCP